jgi:hypothetical protein
MPTYVERAFWDQHNVILIGGALVFSISTASWLPLAGGLLGELCWLAIGPRLPAFKSHVDRKASEQRKARLETVMNAAFGKIAGSAAQRLRVVKATFDDILDTAAETHVSHELLDRAAEQSERLCRTFLELTTKRQELARAAAEIPHGELEHELARLNQLFTAQKDIEARMSLRQAINSSQRRLDHFGELSQLALSLEAKLETIERSASHLKFRARMLASAGQLDTELDALLVDVGSAGGFELSLRDAASSS